MREVLENFKFEREYLNNKQVKLENIESESNENTNKLGDLDDASIINEEDDIISNYMQ